MENFIFDLYNTLIEVQTDEHTESAWIPVVEFFKTRGIKNAEPKRLIYEFDRYWKLFNERATAENRYLYPECDCVTQFESIARSVGGRLSRDDARRALCIMRKASIKTLRPFDGVDGLFSGLKARGAKLYLLSNAQSAFTPQEMEECGLKDSFDGVLLSSDCGCRKPDPEFFGMLFDKYGLDKAKSVMVGDDMENDIRGARRFGIEGIWVPGGAPAHEKELFEAADK